MIKLLSVYVVWLLAAFAANSALAQGFPKYDLSSFPIGQAVTWQTSEGRVEGVNLGLKAGLYIFRTTTFGPNGQVNVDESGFTASSSLVWQRAAGDLEYSIQFSPHDCSFVIGDCYADVFSYGEYVARMLDTAEYANGIWKHTEVMTFEGGDTFTTNYCGIYDNNSLTIALYTYDSDGYVFWQRVSSGPYAAHSAEQLVQVTRACNGPVSIS